MAKFLVWINHSAFDVGTHWKCFIEFTNGLVWALKQLGHDVQGPIADTVLPATDGRKLIAFGVFNSQIALPQGSIIYNAEQIPVHPREEKQRRYIATLHKYRVWDYSQENLNRLAVQGIQAIYCPVGFYSGLEDIPRRDKDIDVLFIGSLNERRKDILIQVARKRLRLKHLFGYYGVKRNEHIARAKVVLNIHYYKDPIFEIFRVSHLLANGKCVVSEDGGCDPALEAFARESTVYVPYSGLADACARMVGDDVLRAGAEEHGRHMMQQLDQVSFVRRALEETDK